MKIHLGFKALTLISLCMFAWSGWIYAQNIDMAWKRDEPGRIWAVTKPGGHMKVGDIFSIERLNAGDDEIRLIPDENLRGRWGSVNSDVNLTKQKFGGKDFLCGFVNVDTDEHERDDDGYTKFGHGKWHGFMIKVKKSNELMIIWSARPLANEKPDKAKCNELEIEFHGGMAHAKG